MSRDLANLQKASFQWLHSSLYTNKGWSCDMELRIPPFLFDFGERKDPVIAMGVQISQMPLCASGPHITAGSRYWYLLVLATVVQVFHNFSLWIQQSREGGAGAALHLLNEESVAQNVKVTCLTRATSLINHNTGIWTLCIWRTCFLNFQVLPHDRKAVSVEAFSQFCQTLPAFGKYHVSMTQRRGGCSRQVICSFLFW